METVWRQELLTVPTSGIGFIDVTRQVRAVVESCRIRTGRCDIFIRHTSASLIIQENADPAVLRDLNRFMDGVVPEGDQWEHSDEGPDDMPAHIRSALTASNLTIPIGKGTLLLGTWQGIFVWEHRQRGHQRQVVVTCSGEADCKADHTAS